MIFLKNYQRKIGSVRTSEMLKSLSELCNAEQAKLVTADITSSADLMSYDILGRRNYTEMRRRFYFNLQLFYGITVVHIIASL